MQLRDSANLHRIYQLEKEKNAQRPPDEVPDAEASPLLAGNVDPDQIFSRALDVEIEKVSSFYQIKELELFGEISEIVRDQDEYDEETQGHHPDLQGLDQLPPEGRPRTRGGSLFRGLSAWRPRRMSAATRSFTDGNEEDSDDEDDEETALNKRRSLEIRRVNTVPSEMDGSQGEDLRHSTGDLHRHSSVAYEDYSDHAFSAALFSSGISLKKRTINLYVQLCELKSFIQLNQTGFRKVLKKYDKILDRNLQNRYLEQTVAPAYPFRPSTIKHVEENIAKMETIYGDVVTSGDLDLAKRELRLHLREHVVWERNTVWREMIGIERKAQAANMGLRRTLLGAEDPDHPLLQGDDERAAELKELRTPVGRVYCPIWLFSSTMFTLIAIVTIFFVLLFIPIMEKTEQQNCLAMLVFVSLLWATEVCPSA